MPDTRGQPLLLTSGSKTVTHDSNGAKSLSVSCSVSTVTSQSYLPGSASISGYTFVLTTIARKSTLYDVSATINNKITLNVTRQNSNFTHTITYKFGSSSATIVSKSSSLSISWTPPLSLYSQIVGNNSGDGTITIETFNGSASLGSNSYKLTLNAFKVYKTPAISNLRYVRGYTTADGDWIDYPTSPNIRIKLTTSVVTGIPNNTTDMTVALSNGLTQTRNNISSTDFEIEFDSIGTTTSYTATVTLSDTIGTIKTWSITISTVEVPFDINVNLLGLACGKVAEKPKTLEFAEGWGIKFGPYSMQDYIVEQGTSGIWTYRKWASGILEYWGKEQGFTLENGAHDSPAGPFAIVNAENSTAMVANWYGTDDNRAVRPNIITCGNLREDGSVSVYDRNPDGTLGTGYRAYCYDVKARWK